MEKNTEVVYRVIEKMALVSDAIDNLYPKARKVVVFELNKEEFEKSKKDFNNIGTDLKQFKIDISGVEFIFILDELLNVSEDIS